MHKVNGTHRYSIVSELTTTMTISVGAKEIRLKRTIDLADRHRGNGQKGEWGREVRDRRSPNPRIEVREIL